MPTFGDHDFTQAMNLHGFAPINLHGGHLFVSVHDMHRAMPPDVFVGDHEPERDHRRNDPEQTQRPRIRGFPGRKEALPTELLFRHLRCGALERFLGFVNQIAKPALFIQVWQLFLDDRKQRQRVLVPLRFLKLARQSVERLQRVKL